ncbi:MAG: sulfatase-like hydrolase/transferase [Oxalobacter sp.]|nr:sulfatase-like hydrolase/transferase [Oxalobacter sp.]
MLLLKEKIKGIFDKRSLLLLLLLILLYVSYLKLCDVHQKIFPGIFLNVLAFFLVLKIRGWFRYVAILYVTITFAINITCGLLYHSRIQYFMLASAFETDIKEALGFISFSGIFPVIIFLGLPVLFAFLTSPIHTNGISWIGKTILIIIVIFPVINIAFFHHRADISRYELKKYPFDKLSEIYDRNKFLLVRLPLLVLQYYETTSNLEDALTRKRLLPEGINLLNYNDKISPKRILFILGESDSKWHHGIYGYEIKTDKFIQYQSGYIQNTVIFNALSPAPLTRESVPRMLTFANARDFSPYINNTNIIDMAKIAGYSSFWLSKQANVGLHDTLIRIIAQSADKTVFQSEGLDIELLKDFERYVNKNQKQFFIMHINGSHINYSERHDESDFMQVKDAPEAVRHYDATIVHTDRLLEELNRYADDKTLIIYCPDHGEIVNKGHGFPAKDLKQYEIPFFAWSKSHELIEQFKKSVYKNTIKDGKLFNTASLPLVFAEIMGFSVSDSYRKHELEESEYILTAEGTVESISKFQE